MCYFLSSEKEAPKYKAETREVKFHFLISAAHLGRVAVKIPWQVAGFLSPHSPLPSPLPSLSNSGHTRTVTPCQDSTVWEAQWKRLHLRCAQRSSYPSNPLRVQMLGLVATLFAVSVAYWWGLDSRFPFQAVFIPWLDSVVWPSSQIHAHINLHGWQMQ